MDGTSLTPEQEKINALRLVLPEAFSEGKIDWEKLKVTLGENINFANERYVLNWAGKSDAFKVLQTPSTKTLVPAKDESVNFNETENLFIEGENLEVLKVLQKSYFGKVKMIYIDPPYNTGNDSFIYPDKFSESKADYEKRVGDKDEDGYMTKDGMFKKNSKENGQYHSNWLNMMMPRLYLAKNLLRQDGVIFVSIDDNEVHNLRLLMNEVFGEENFISQAGWQKVYSPKNQAKYLSNDYEYVLIYSKQLQDFEIGLLPRTDEMNKRYSNPDNDPRGPWKSGDLVAAGERKGGHYIITNPNTGKEYDVPSGKHWAYSESSMKELLNDNRITFGINGDSFPSSKQFLSEVKQGRVASSLFSYKDFGHTDEAKKDFIKLFGEEGRTIFETLKPVRFIKMLTRIANVRNGDIVLDFFVGSGTTAHSIFDLNKEDLSICKFVCVQLPELCEEKSEAYKAGYKTIAEISKERILRAGKKIKEEIKTEIKKLEAEIKKLQGELPTEENKTEIENLKTKIEQLNNQDLGFKVLKLEDSNFKQWQQIEGKDAKALAEQMKLFVDPVSENATIENMVYELLLKSGKDLNSNIEKKGSFYKINGTELILLLEKATQEIIDAVIAEKPIKVIALDKLFKGNDQLKTNSVLQMKDAGVEFKTI
jgi:adenine-specific DNA-methyltransferase